jgi:D-alanine-D-alanine ligase
MNIAVLLGGISPERNVSFASGKAIAEALMAAGHTVRLIDPARGADCEISIEEISLTMDREVTDEELLSFQPGNLLACVNSAAFDGIDIVFLALHGRYGEDGYIQSLLDLRGIRYTGSKMASSALAMDKIMSKRLMHSVGIPTPEWTVAGPEQADDYAFLEEVRNEIRGKLVVKPNDQGSTVGVTIVENGNLDDIRIAIHEALRYSSLALIEKFIAGREVTVGVLGGEALPVVEIIPHDGFYDYQHKYSKGHTEYQCPADILEHDTEFLQNLAATAHHVLGCTAYSRVDFRIDEDGSPFCLEVNTLPGMTSQSLLPKAAAAAEIDFTALCEKIIELS